MTIDNFAAFDAILMDEVNVERVSRSLGFRTEKGELHLCIDRREGEKLTGEDYYITLDGKPIPKESSRKLVMSIGFKILQSNYQPSKLENRNDENVS